MSEYVQIERPEDSASFRAVLFDDKGSVVDIVESKEAEFLADIVLTHFYDLPVYDSTGNRLDNNEESLAGNIEASFS